MKSKAQRAFMNSFVIAMMVLVTFTPGFHVYATEPNSAPGIDLPEVVDKYVNAINNKDWGSFVLSYSPERQKDYAGFPKQYQMENRTGILSVDSIRVYEAKEIPSEHIMEIEPHFKEIDDSLYNDIRYFYIGFDCRVCKESEFFYNGVKYELLAIGRVDETEYIIGHENVYDIRKLEKYGYAFHSKAEEKAQNVVDQREKGVIVNFNSDILSSNADSGIQEEDKDIEQSTEIEDEAVPSEPEINELINELYDSDNGKSQEQIDLKKACQKTSLVYPQSVSRPPSNRGRHLCEAE